MSPAIYTEYRISNLNPKTACGYSIKWISVFLGKCLYTTQLLLSRRFKNYRSRLCTIFFLTYNQFLSKSTVKYSRTSRDVLMKLRLSGEMSSMDLASMKMFTAVSVFILILLRTDFRTGHVCIKTVIKNASESSQ